ncbi:MAG: ribosome small subunit-dependent GTPase A [Bacteroidota bacterium]|nr:ribosome small subunit-dependent GTPase A [Bacteroidota bacterium]
MSEGLIVKSTGSWYQIENSEGIAIPARATGKLRLRGYNTTNPIAVGDIVEYKLDAANQDAVIVSVHNRKNYIIRKSNNLSNQQQIIAANLDYTLIVATLAYPRTSQGFIDRILVTSEAYEITALIMWNKADLYDVEMLEVASKYVDIYKKLGYESALISVKTGQGMPELIEKLQGKTTLISGHSGVGKSSLMNLLAPNLKLKTGDISMSTMKGKHTTTFAEMHKLNADTRIIDTPGIKDFGLVQMKSEEISHYFPEMRQMLGQCRFSNCMHLNEPGCKVINAVEAGEIDGGRFNSYQGMILGEDTHS